MNLCQAIVKPDCSKPKVQKAHGIQNALVHLLSKVMPRTLETQFWMKSQGKCNWKMKKLLYTVRQKLSTT